MILIMNPDYTAGSIVSLWTTRVGIEDITGLPWIEIAFPEDIMRARKEILPTIHGR